MCLTFMNGYTLIVKVKIEVLYTCMFAAYLYGVETWWKIDEVSNQLLLLEGNLLKNI